MGSGRELERERENRQRKERGRERKRERGRESLEYIEVPIFIYILLEVTFFSPSILCPMTLTIIIIHRYFVNNNFCSPSLL